MNSRIRSRELIGQRVLVTGASGFLGTHLAESLRAFGAEVHGVSRSRRRDAADGIRWWQANLADVREVERVWEAVQPAVVYHLAGEVNGAPTLDLLLPTYHSLLTTTVNLLSVSIQRGCRRLVLIGSLEEVDIKDAGAPPASPYGAAKTAASSYATMCHQLFGAPVVILRTFMSYGPGQPEWKLIPSTIRALVNGASPRLSSGKRELDWVYIDDVVEAFIAASYEPGIEGMTLDVGSGRLTPIEDIVRHLVQLVDPRIEPQFGKLPDRPERPARAAEIVRTLTYLKWRSHTGLEDGLMRTLESYLQGVGRASV
jgi:nucleoside-diphosphate-sugar epimerase